MSNFPFDTGHTLRRLSLRVEYNADRQLREKQYADEMRQYEQDKARLQLEYIEDMHRNRLQFEKELIASRRMVGLD